VLKRCAPSHPKDVLERAKPRPLVCSPRVVLVVILGSICWGIVFGSVAAVIWRLAGASESISKVVLALVVLGVIGYALTPDKPAWASPGQYIGKHSDSVASALMLLVILAISAVGAFLTVQRISPNRQPPRQ
jgi:hypothetical protein